MYFNHGFIPLPRRMAGAADFRHSAICWPQSSSSAHLLQSKVRNIWCSRPRCYSIIVPLQISMVYFAFHPLAECSHPRVEVGSGSTSVFWHRFLFFFSQDALQEFHIPVMALLFASHNFSCPPGSPWESTLGSKENGYFIKATIKGPSLPLLRCVKFTAEYKSKWHKARESQPRNLRDESHWQSLKF